MEQFEIISLFVNKALSMKGENVSVYYQSNVSLIEIYGWKKGVPMSGDSQVKYSYYLDTESPATKEILVSKLEMLEKELTVS